MPDMRLAPLLAAVLVVAGCGSGGQKTTLPKAPAGMVLSSPAFASGGTLPTRFTCSGGGRTPPLRWSRVPTAAGELALVVVDPDAPGGGFVHWTAYGIPSDANTVPRDARQGTNSAGGRGWAPACPPHGKAPHRYVFSLYALPRPSGLEAGASPAAVTAAIRRADPIARAQLIGRFGRR